MADPSIQKKPGRLWILAGIPVLFLAAGPMHFVYDWSGNSLMVGLFAPVNKSVWEHQKLFFWPMLVWWLSYYSIIGKKKGISAAQWCVPLALSEIGCLVVILSFFYTYTGAFCIESLLLDIVSLLLGLAAGQVLALHVYQRVEIRVYWLYFPVFLLTFMAAAFVIFTFYPPRIPLFEVQ